MEEHGVMEPFNLDDRISDEESDGQKMEEEDCDEEMEQELTPIDVSKFNFAKYAYKSGVQHVPSQSHLSRTIKKGNKFVSPFFHHKHLTPEERAEARAISAKRYRNDPNRKFESYVSSAERRGKEWKLSSAQAQILFKSDCHYCGKAATKGALNGIDRVDNSRGYIEDNVVACCSACNMCKGRHDVKLWLRTCMKVTKHLCRMMNEEKAEDDLSDDDTSDIARI